MLYGDGRLATGRPGGGTENLFADPPEFAWIPYAQVVIEISRQEVSPMGAAPPLDPPFGY